jgi:hypothetical protein
MLMKSFLRRVNPITRSAQMIKSLMSKMKKDRIGRHRKITSAIFLPNISSPDVRGKRSYRSAQHPAIVPLPRWEGVRG